MKRLNNRGYLIVELILASVLAMTVAYFLLNLVVKMSAKNQDLYLETELLTDKAIMTNMVMEDVNKYTLIKIDQKSSEDNKVSKILLRFNYYDSTENNKQKTMDKMVTTDINTKEFKYGEVNCTTFAFDSCSYKGDTTITKKLNSNISTSSVSASTTTNTDSNNKVNDSILSIDNNLKTLYSNANYGLNLTIPYNSKVLEFKPTISVKSDYKNGYEIYYPNNLSDYTEISNLFEYFPSNGNISCDKKQVKDVGTGVGTYKIYCTISYSFNGNEQSASNFVDIKVLAASTPDPDPSPSSSPKYLYYTNNVSSSQGNDTESFNIYRCKDDNTDCNRVAGASGMITSTTASLNFGLAPINGSDKFYYSSCRYGNSKTIDVYNVYDTSGNIIGGAAGFSRVNGNISISSAMASNSSYVYYSSATTYNSQYSNNFNLYACNIENNTCNSFAYTTVYANSGNGNANGNGVSFELGITANENYVFYTNYSGTSATIYRCNKDGSNCQAVSSASGWAFTGSGSELYPKLIADNKNLYYTSVNNKNGGTSIYKCNSDGTGCSSIIGATGFAGAKGQGINVDIAINKKYLYYTTDTGGKGDYAYMTIYKCDRDGSNCKSKGGGGSTLLAGRGIGPQITANDNYVYYTSAGWNRSGSSRINSFSVYKCKIEMDDCDDVKTISGFANPNTGSTIPYKIMLTN